METGQDGQTPPTAAAAETEAEAAVDGQNTQSFKKSGVVVLLILLALGIGASDGLFRKRVLRKYWNRESTKRGRHMVLIVSLTMRTLALSLVVLACIIIPRVFEHGWNNNLLKKISLWTVAFVALAWTGAVALDIREALLMRHLDGSNSVENLRVMESPERYMMFHAVMVPCFGLFIVTAFKLGR